MSTVVVQPLTRRTAPPGTDGGYDALVAAARDDEVATRLAAAGVPNAVITGPLAGWAEPTSWQVRTLVQVHEGDRVVGVGLVTARPLTRALRLAGWWSALPGSAAVARALVDAVVALGRTDAAATVTLTVAPDDPTLWETGLAAGFTPLTAPASGAPLPHEPGALPRGLRLVLAEVAADRPVPYMRQTTDYTCGPVAGSMALAGVGLAGAPDRRGELALWREATYVPGCDPFGLALALASRGAAPTVWSSTTEPTLIDEATAPGTQEMQQFVLGDFRDRALAAGLPLRLEAPTVADLHEHLLTGGLALLLIDQHPMHLEPCPHWITAHGVWHRGEESGVLVDDPWTDVDLGETWLDATGLPLPDATVDLLWGWGGARSALLLPA
ncbi:MAG: peptidase C39 family protein [Actinobacteria bacterium]|nr:peptidase C39 family protein [Actinomycetota bacterium]MCG2802118.1 peptidase C39 family protein [Cellulomonas sp.]